jgi:hypothetical protein
MSDKFKLGIVCYVAPRGLANADAFFANIRNFPTKHELVIYSDHDYSKEWPGMTKLNGSVEVAKTDTNRMAVNNLVFFTGLRIAANKGFTHVLILEHDCRVGVAGWDEIIWQEFLSKNPDAIMGGSLVAFNPCSFSRKGAELFEELVIGTKAGRLMPFHVCGSPDFARKHEPSIFPMGAFAIYRMDWLLKTFPEITGTPEQYIGLSMKLKTWDYAIGIRLWQVFNENSYQKLVNLETVYSGYGNVLCSEAERRQWLEEGKIVGVHQIKSDWPGPIPNAPKISIPTPQTTAVTCTGDRPEAFALCEKWMARQTKKPDQWIVLDDGKIPTKCTMGQQYIFCPQFSGSSSLIEKLKLLYSDNLVKGNVITFIEDDDWYRNDWIEFCSKTLVDYDLIGEGRAFYYNIMGRWCYEHRNMEHASLCSTAMRSSLLPTLFGQCRISNPFVDVRLWRMVTNRKKVFDPLERPDKTRMVVGMKGFPGRVGYGGGHVVRDRSAKDDPNLQTLRSLVGSDSEIYKKFSK